MTEEKHICEKMNSEQRVAEEQGYKMNRYCKECSKLMQEDVPISTFEGLLRAWVHGETGKKKVVGKYRVNDEETKLEYHGSGRTVGLGVDVLALKLKDGRIIGNASSLERCGSYRSGNEAPAQRVMFDLRMAMIPFNVFSEAELDIQTAKVIEQGAEEDLLMPKMVWSESRNEMIPVRVKQEGWSQKKVKSDDKKEIIKSWKSNGSIIARTKTGRIKKDKWKNPQYKNVSGWAYKYFDLTQLEERHFVGAMLLSVNRKYFLFDIDRKETKFYRFNPFLAQIPKKAKSIKEAYEMLIPEQIAKAIKKGLAVDRQGEWFFIPTVKFDEKGIPKFSDRKQKIIDNSRPLRESFDLERYVSNIYESSGSSDLRIESIKSMKDNYDFSEVNKKYRPNILSRLRDYNKALKKYIILLKGREDFLAKNNYFQYGGELKAGENRPNSVDNLLIKDGVHYIKGWVKHTGREHEDIFFDKWHIAVPNTAINSFTITGQID